MIDLNPTILIAGLAAFLVLGLIFWIVHLFVMVLYGSEDDRATVYQKQAV